MATLTITNNAQDGLKNTIPWQPILARLNGQPLDATSIFENIDLAKNYASTSSAYVGQYISVRTGSGTDDDPYRYCGYIITDEEGTLKPTTYYAGSNIHIEDDGTITAVGDLEGAATKVYTTATKNSNQLFLTFVNSNNTSSQSESLFTNVALKVIPGDPGSGRPASFILNDWKITQDSSNGNLIFEKI